MIHRGIGVAWNNPLAYEAFGILAENLPSNLDDYSNTIGIFGAPVSVSRVAHKLDVYIDGENWASAWFFEAFSIADQTDKWDSRSLRFSLPFSCSKMHPRISLKYYIYTDIFTRMCIVRRDQLTHREEATIFHLTITRSCQLLYCCHVYSTPSLVSSGFSYSPLHTYIYIYMDRATTDGCNFAYIGDIY